MITDFGLSKSQEILTSIAGCTPHVYCDPQFLNDSSYKRDKTSDIYSLGLLFWEISSGKIPNAKIGLIDIIKGKRETPVDGTPLDYVEIYSRAWQDDPKQRPTIEMILDDIEKIKLQPIYQTKTVIEKIQTDDSLYLLKDSSISYDFNSDKLLIDTVQEEIIVIDNKIPESNLQDQRNDVRSYFPSRNYVKALELWEVILKDPQHTKEDKKNASKWDLSRKYLKESELKVLCEALSKNNIITYLDLQYCNIGGSGGKALAEALSKNTTLTVLYLSNNDIGESGGKALAEALSKNTTLTRLDLSRYKIGGEFIFQC